MKARREYLFSDSANYPETVLPRDLLDFHLDSLGSRKQEYEFEHFARLLSEAELCPNLVPQTGPTAGGDGKVDTDTYPVAEEIAERWFMGKTGSEKERWAFAFSTQKTWKPKVRKDVKSIHGSGRKYKQIYFITNQYCPAKDIHKEQDDLSNKYGINVTILDRTWILDHVYKNDHVELAARALQIESAQTTIKRQIGPADLSREKELTELDAQIRDPNRYTGSRYALAEDCLESALIARGLERPRLETEARFDSAIKFAREAGMPKQILRMLYNKAWSLHWWHNDVAYVADAYDEIERLALATDDAGDAELVQNLWMLILPSVALGRLNAEKAQLMERLARLKDHLSAIIGNTERPNNALNARSALQLLRISELQLSGNIDKLDEVWSEFRQIIAASRSHPGYSLSRLNDLLDEIGKIAPESSEFDSLTDDLAEAFSAQVSNGEGGKVYLRRGLQKLEKDLHFDAIVMLGKAEPLLAALDHREDLIQAQLAISRAYQQSGLLWAARNKALLACDRLLSTIAESAEVDPRALVALKHLAWLETRLGRLPHLLAIIQLMETLKTNARLSKRAKKTVEENRVMQEGVLSIQLINANISELNSLTKLPDALSRLGLNWARMCLLWALGQTQTILDEGYLPEGDGLDDLTALMEKADSQPAKVSLPNYMYLGQGEDVTIRSTILGCSFECTIQNERSSICLAEMVLGALESFLATSLETRSIPYREKIELRFERGESVLNSTPTYTISHSGILVTIRHNFDALLGAASAWGTLVEWLQELVVALSAHILVISDHRAWIERIAGREDGFTRALALNQVAIATDNVFGPPRCLSLESYIEDTDTDYPLVRDIPWNAARTAQNSSERKSQSMRPGQGSPPDGMFDRTKSRHDEHRVISVIDLPQWDRAKWCATGFALSPDYPLPFVCLAFDNLDAGRMIFQGWKERFGELDTNEAIRVSILRGIDRHLPHHYRVVVSANVEAAELEDTQTMFFTNARINTMTPDSSENLENIIRLYQGAGQYVLAPMSSPKDGPPVLISELGIIKSDLFIRDAYEVGLNEPEAVAIREDDEPLIPDGISDAPIHAVLERAKEMMRGERGDNI